VTAVVLPRYPLIPYTVFVINKGINYIFLKQLPPNTLYLIFEVLGMGNFGIFYV
jgi:hypothetical protein